MGHLGLLWDTFTLLFTVDPVRVAAYLPNYRYFLPSQKYLFFFLHPVHAVSNHDCDVKLVVSNVFPSSKRRLSSSSLGQAFVFIMPFVKQVMGELDLLPTPGNCFCHHTDPHVSSSVQPASYLALITINRS